MPKDQEYSSKATGVFTNPRGTTYDYSRNKRTLTKRYGQSYTQSKPYIRTLPWSSNFVDVKTPVVSLIFRDPRYSCSAVPGPVAVPNSLVSYVSLQSASKSPVFNILVSALHKDLSTAQLLAPVALAEARSTADMCVGVVFKLVKSMENVKRGRFLQAARDLGLAQVPSALRKKLRKNRKRKQPTGFEDAWMEYRYGWAPLLSDIKTSVDIACETTRTEGMKLEGTINRVSSVVEGDYWAGDTSSYLPGTMDGGQWGFHRIVDNGRLWYSCTVNAAATRLNQYGLLNPAQIAYELVPFSFVVDWFVNVGDVIESFGRAQTVSNFVGGIHVKRKFLTNNIRLRITGSMPYFNSDPFWIFTGASRSQTIYVREPLSSVPLPTLTLTTNPFSDSSKRVLDSAYLLSSVYNKLRRS